MTTRITPPTYNSKKSYELYKQELLAWREITDLDDQKQGVVIALSLPEDDESKIREKVFDQIKLDDLKKDDGLDTLIEFLDQQLGKDDLTDSLEKFEDFEDCQRAEGQRINDFVATFDAKYRKIEKKNMKLPPEILAFKLLKRANLTKEEKMLVLTGMNYNIKETLYEEAKRSLKKFKGETTDSGAKMTSIKLEPAFLAENEEALLAAGYVRGRYPINYNSFRGNKGSRGGYGRNSYGNQRGMSRGNRTGPKKSINPTGPDGKVLTCKSCGSFRHLIADCPDSWENLSKVNVAEEEQAVLFTGYQREEVAKLSVEARNCAVLDSACSSTVCGENWLNAYISSMPTSDREKIQFNEGHKVFKFGGGTRLKSKGEYHLPAVLADKEVTIKTDVVESDIPLLLSRKSMKKADVKLDLTEDTATIFGKEISLNLTSSGHYCVPIDKQERITVESVCTVELEHMSEDKRLATLQKLHRQFAHPPQKKLKALLKDANAWRDEFESTLTEINENCDLCKVYAKTPPRPVVALPMANRFNEKVAMDLKQWKGRWILHMIDMWSRYTISTFIDRKRPSDVVDAVMKQWIGVFGVMKAIMSDNGGEFSSDEMREVTSILNVQVITTAGQSPFQNGLCERVHAVTDMMLLKLEADTGKRSDQTMLCWANMARNSLQMWNGFSSHQLVFGENPNLPGIMTDGPPALHGSTSSEKFASHLNILHASRKAFIETEADERIRRALRHKVRVSEERFDNGDRVFYKREGKERWLGPGKVVFQDGKIIFVRHGGVFVRVSPNRLIKISSSENDIIENMPANVSKDKVTETENKLSITEEIPTKQSKEDQIEEKFEPLKPKDRIKYRIADTDEWISAIILGRAGKASGKYKNWYNIQDTETQDKKSVDLGSIRWTKSNEPTEAVHLVIKDESTLAKQAEIEKLRYFNTFTEVEEKGQTTLSTRWVMTEKEGKVKARLVVRGFEEEFDLPRDSPTVGKGAMKVFFTLAAKQQWTVKTTDIKSAFLQGKDLERDVFLKPPKESDTPPNMIWKLTHCLYGLKDGARQFYLSVKDELLKLGFQQNELDPAVFFVRKANKLQGILCCHVDDFLHAGDADFERLMVKLRERFKAGKIEEKQFRYIGFLIDQKEDSIIMDHTDYMDKIQCQMIDVQRAVETKDDLDPKEQTMYRQIIGQLNWAVQGSRPDMAFNMINFSTKLKQATVSDLVKAIKVVNSMKNTRSIIKFPSLEGEPKDWRLEVFTDASLGNLNDNTGSTGAYIIWITDKNGNCCPITWQANKIRRVVRSTIAAEALSLQEGLEACFYYRKMLEDIIGVRAGTIPIIAVIDNKSVIEAVYSTKMVDDKRLRVDIAAIREQLETNTVSKIKWCPGKLQLADCMTKQGASGYELMNILQNGKFNEHL